MLASIEYASEKSIFPILVTYFAAQWKTEEIHGKKFVHI